MRDFRDDIGKPLKIWWYTILTLSMGTSLFDGTFQNNLAVVVNINWLIILQNLVMIVVVVGVCVGLTKLHPIFKWSLFSLFKSREEKMQGKQLSGTNINLMPMQVKYFGLLFALLVMVNVPSWAMIEEKWFRAGTAGWVDGLFVSFLFGMAHCLAGVPIGAGVAITFAGLWFTHQYFVGGIEISALHHTAYNLILISGLFLALVLEHIGELSKRKSKIV